ncbi:hypothetical protein [Phycicoccus avicenniae]|uniref:hypothetical protein n=1 Tax=Phycicoccus avicenniae TaxID=2828860 RepID=UPI003D28BA11
MTQDAGRLLPDRTDSRSLAGPDGRDVVKIESLDVEAGQQLVLTLRVVGAEGHSPPGSATGAVDEGAR